MRLRIERVKVIAQGVHGANGSHTGPAVFNEHYALGTAPRTK